MDAVIICRPCLPKFGAIAANNAFWHVHRDKVTRGLSSLPAHHLAFPLALLAQAYQHQARAVPNCTYIGSPSSHRLVMPRRGLETVPVDPLPSDCEGFPEVAIGAIDRDMSRPAALMHQGNGCSHNM